ncbi:MAG: nitroreductase family protein [Parasporobacterium sp.]|nr:nitroreductase family protein [Parasporobacterium sp.]
MFIVDNSLCIQCGTCAAGCPNHAISLEDNEIKHDASRCNSCGHCLAQCPRDAIMIDGDGYDVEEVEEFSNLTKPTAKQIRRQIMMRRSVRHFNEEEVTEEELQLILEAAKYAPTAKNCQDNFLLVIKNPENRAELLDRSMEVIGQLGKEFMDKVPGLGAFFTMKYKMYKENGEDGLFYNAPVVIFVFSGSDLDGAFCAASMMQMIDAQEMGGCYLQLAADPFNKDKEMKSYYEIPEDKKCVIAIALGHTDDEYFSSVPRKNVPVVWR